MTIISENLRRSIKDTYRDFASNTSIHGTQNTIDGSKFTRFIWTIVVLSALGVSVYMLLLIWWRFTSGPTITYIETAYGSTYRLPFPAITICNNNKIMEWKLDAFVNTLDLFGRSKEDVKRAIPQVLALASMQYLSRNTSDIHWIRGLLEQNGLDEFKAYLKISQSCDELLLRCMWEDRVYSCKELFTETFTIYGRCCTFNSNVWNNETTLYTEHYGIHMGLQVVTNNTKERTYNALNFRGITVTLHNAQELVRSSHPVRAISSGSVAFLQIFGTIIEDDQRIEDLPLEQRHCIYNKDPSNNYFPLYTDENCRSSCEIRRLFDNCQCVSYMYKSSGKPLCDSTKLKCLREHKNTSCVCYSQCESIIYELLSSGSNLVQEETAMSSFLDDLDISASSLIYVFYPRETYTHIKRAQVTNDLYILSSLGGIFGLLLGCSFTSVAEMLYEILIRFIINLKVLNKVRTEEIPWTNKPRNIYYDKKAFYN